jgi:hypothetical protein
VTIVQAMGGILLPVGNKLFRGHSDVVRDFPKKRRSEVTTTMIRHRRAAPVGMAELHVRPSLPHARKPQRIEDRHNFTWFEDWQFGHLNRW